MLNTRYEEYSGLNIAKSFVLFSDLIRTPNSAGGEMNWHENIELQFCTEGTGSVLLDGEKIPFNEGDIVTVNSNTIHYTTTDTFLKYSALIISTDFLNEMGFEYSTMNYTPKISDEALYDLLLELKTLYLKKDIYLKNPKQNLLLIKILLCITERYSAQKETLSQSKTFERVRGAIKYIRNNYHKKIALETIAKSVYTDKYILSREFKKVTGKTVVQFINTLRCQIASNLISEGHTVSEAAILCGFENLSFFTKTFKKYMGVLPSNYKF